MERFPTIFILLAILAAAAAAADDNDKPESLIGDLLDSVANDVLEETSGCSWKRHRNSFAGGDHLSDYMSRQAAQAECIKNGDLCGAVTCRGDNGKCNVRADKYTQHSNYGETTWTPVGNCFEPRTPQPDTVYNTGGWECGRRGDEEVAVPGNCGEGDCAWLCHMAHDNRVWCKDYEYKKPFCHLKRELNATIDCIWTQHNNSFAGGHHLSDLLSYKDAQDKCIELGESTCGAVTCRGDNGKCNVRADTHVQSSPNNETTWTPSGNCFGG
jgi:hypothetical protein